MHSAEVFLSDLHVFLISMNIMGQLLQVSLFPDIANWYDLVCKGEIRDRIMETARCSFLKFAGPHVYA